MSAVSTPDQRLHELLTLRDRIDAEIRRCQRQLAEGARVRRSRHVRPPCGTEEGYHWHHYRGQKCQPCAVAHREHNRLADARRRARRLLARVEAVA